ncbi:hypothetical protein Y032_0370g99 [Ancylostoma ceylanicum]|uniref:Uncharacterized protein n=1 Tax=Ancylostoma ceylanicum TaxID=53326 RepID=A0A016RUI3_9BILA|nr:hypothetical protein Y032_0370g99 [Ancylostoma ceylanicum]
MPHRPKKCRGCPPEPFIASILKNEAGFKEHARAARILKNPSLQCFSEFVRGEATFVKVDKINKIDTSYVDEIDKIDMSYGTNMILVISTLNHLYMLVFREIVGLILSEVIYMVQHFSTISSFEFSLFGPIRPSIFFGLFSCLQAAPTCLITLMNRRKECSRERFGTVV